MDYKLRNNDKKLDEQFVNKLKNCVVLANKIANKQVINKADIKERDKGTIDAVLGSLVQSVYYNNDEQNYLDIATQILIRLANKHAFFDGNKRTALFSSILVLDESLNIEIEFSHSTEQFVSLVLQAVAQKDKSLDAVKNFLNDEANHAKKTVFNIEEIAKKYQENAKAIKIIDALENV